MFGIEVDNIDNDFETFDENKDGIVSMQESTNALKNLVLDRTDIPKLSYLCAISFLC